MFLHTFEYLLRWEFHIIHSGKSKVLQVSVLVDCQCQGTDRNSCPQIAVRSQVSLSTMNCLCVFNKIQFNGNTDSNNGLQRYNVGEHDVVRC